MKLTEQLTLGTEVPGHLEEANANLLRTKTFTFQDKRRYSLKRAGKGESPRVAGVWREGAGKVNCFCWQMARGGYQAKRSP